MLKGQPQKDLTCSYEILVTTPVRAPAWNIPVSASTKEGTGAGRTTTDIHGLARICDAPIDTPVDIRIGDGGCAVTVANVYPLWLETRHVEVIYEPCSSEELFFSQSCFFVLRIRDEGGAPLSGVLIKPDAVGTENRENFLSDQYGRAFRSLKWRSSFDATLEKSGFESTHFKLTCDSTSEVRRERIVTLRSSRQERPK